MAKDFSRTDRPTGDKKEDVSMGVIGVNYHKEQANTLEMSTRLHAYREFVHRRTCASRMRQGNNVPAHHSHCDFLHNLALF